MTETEAILVQPQLVLPLASHDALLHCVLLSVQLGLLPAQRQPRLISDTCPRAPALIGACCPFPRLPVADGEGG